MRISPIVLSLIASGLGALVAADVPPASALEESRGHAAARSVYDGVYTAAQARRGEDMFRDHCGSCHEPDRFTGRSFVVNWAGPLDALFSSIRTSMPEDNPGGLSPQIYADVIAYWLRLNGYPAGAEGLEGTNEAMRNVQLEAPEPAEAQRDPPAR